MKRIVAILLTILMLFSLFQGTLRENTVRADSQPICPRFNYNAKNTEQCSYDTAKSNILEFVTVTIEAKDESGNLLDSPKIFAYSMDWGIIYPKFGNFQNQCEITIPKGVWEFVATARSNSPKGYFLVKKLDVDFSQKIVLAPDAQINLAILDNTENLNQVSILMVDRDLVPLATPGSVLQLSSTNANVHKWGGKIYTNEGFQYSLVLNANCDKTNEQFIIFEDDVKPDTILNIPLNEDNFASIDFKFFDKMLSPVNFSIRLLTPSFCNWFLFGDEALEFQGRGSKRLFITPGNWVFEPKILVFVDNFRCWSYTFAEETVDLNKDSSLEFSYGGEFKPTVKVLYFGQETQLFIETKDVFGNLLRYFYPPYDPNNTQKRIVPLKLFQNSSLIFEMNLAEYDPNIVLYGNRIDKELDINNSPDYLIELEMGSFGFFVLKGKLFSAETNLEYETLSTENFILHYPKGYRKRFETYGNFIEKVHKSLENYTEIQIEKPTYIDFVFGNYTGSASKSSIVAGAAEVLYDSPYSISEDLIPFHEHSHNFQLERQNTYFINTTFGEHIAEEVASFAYGDLWGYPAKLWILGGIQPWLYGAIEYIKDPQSHPLNPQEPYDLQSGCNMAFILRFLELKFGEDIHKKFIASWSKTESPMYIPKSYFGSLEGDFEKIAVVYSVLTKDNLSSLFNYMGFSVNSDRIDQFISKVFHVTPPQNLSASFSNSSVILTWTPSQPGTYPIAGYVIYKGTSSGSEFSTPVATIPANTNTTAYTDTNVTSGTTYYYYVKAFDDQSPPNYSEPSNEVSTNTYTITTSSGSGGSITPSGTITVNSGESKTFTITLYSGYKISNVKVDGISKGSISSYIFTNVTSNHTIEAIFEKEITQTTIILQIGNSSFTVNGISNILDSPPVIKNSRTLLPIRVIIEALGGTVGWDANEKKVTVTLGSTTIELWIGKSTAKVNGVNTLIDLTNTKVVPEIINSRTMLPLRFITENLGCDVQWDGTTKTITITYPAP